METRAAVTTRSTTWGSRVGASCSTSPAWRAEVATTVLIFQFSTAAHDPRRAKPFEMKFVLATLTVFASVVVAQDELLNTTSTNSSIGVNAGSMPIELCDGPSGALKVWYYGSKSNRQNKCSTVDSSKKWGMINAYRGGGQEGVHWKYTNDPNDGECMYDWKYYSDNGQNLITTVSGHTTFQGSSRRWCALPVYRQGGVQGKQWGYCSCRWYFPPRWD